MAVNAMRYIAIGLYILLISGCSTEPVASSVATDAALSADSAQDSAASKDGQSPADGAAVADVSDTSADLSSPADTQSPSDAASGPDIDYELLDPEDTADIAPDVPLLDSGLAVVFAHSSTQLYRLESNVFTSVGTFQFDKAFGQVTDIALDDTGLLFAVTFDDLFQCDKASAKCKWLAALPQQFNGLTFVAKDVVTPGKPALIGIANSGDWNLITVTGTTATITKLGAYGGFSSSGDAFSVEGIGTYATVKSGFGGTDKLVQVNPANGAVLKTVGDTGVSDLWGVAWSNQVLYGFSDDGKVYSLDIQTGKASTIPGLQVPKVSWWGAGVSTRAALK